MLQKASVVGLTLTLSLLSLIRMKGFRGFEILILIFKFLIWMDLHNLMSVEGFNGLPNGFLGLGSFQDTMNLGKYSKGISSVLGFGSMMKGVSNDSNMKYIGNIGSRTLNFDTGNDSVKKADGISGFLGFEDMLNPIIQMKRLLPGNPNPEPDCIRTYFMSPFAKSITFFANGSIGARTDGICKWNFIGTEPCIPLLNCPIFNLRDKDEKCKDYFEVYDGNVGFQKFCGKNGPSNISAYGGLRDLYLTYKAFKSTPDDGTVKFNCTVSCSNRGDGISLLKEFKPNLNTLCQCGKRPNQDRIVNGENATKHEYPWMVALVRAQTRQPFCGASILNDRVIVTAGHCFKGNFLQVTNLEIILGGHVLDITPNFAVLNQTSRPQPKTYDPITLQKLDAGNGSVRHTIEEIIIHPLYVKPTNDFDFAIIRLTNPIDFAKFPQLNPVCIPKLGSYLRTFAKQTGIVAGWGLGGAEHKGTQSILQKLNVTIYAPRECKETYAHRVNRRMMCAGFVDGGKDSCMGDSGGPLVLEDRPQVWYQIGAVSWGDECALSKSPGVYIRLTEVAQWIHYHSNIKEAVWCAVPSPTNKNN